MIKTELYINSSAISDDILKKVNEKVNEKVNKCFKWIKSKIPGLKNLINTINSDENDIISEFNEDLDFINSKIVYN